MINLSFESNAQGNLKMKCGNVSFLFCQEYQHKIAMIQMKKKIAIFAYDVVVAITDYQKPKQKSFLLKDAIIIKEIDKYQISTSSYKHITHKFINIQINYFDIKLLKDNYNLYKKKKELGLNLIEVINLDKTNRGIKTINLLEYVTEKIGVENEKRNQKWKKTNR